MLRRPDSIPSTDTIITDPVLEPFFISKSSTGGFTVYERVIKGDNDTEYIKTVCYPGNFGYALKIIAEEKTNSSNNKSFSTIKDYVLKFKSYQEKITSIMGA
jgi:hypothetical protein|tara:strand:+ start:1567 stop:1872 length:306 start_codon:yes stop_codon:yes gene_type:complete